MTQTGARNWNGSTLMLVLSVDATRTPSRAKGLRVEMLAGMLAHYSGEIS